MVLSIPDGQILEGNLKVNKMKLVQAWIEIQQDELMANWNLASQGEQIFRIDPLQQEGDVVNPRVEAVKPNDDYTVTLKFTNGELKVFDVKPYLDKGFFRELKAQAYFHSVRAALGTIQWQNGQDFCPDTLYKQSVFASSEPTAHPDWRYAAKVLHDH